MPKIRAILMCLVVALVTFAFTMPPAGLENAASITTQSPAVAGLVKLTFVNKTGATIPVLALKGAKTYYFYNVPTGQNTFYVPKGKYLVHYMACGRDRLKYFTITSDVKFITVACPTAKITILNKTGSTLFLYLSGPASYTLALLPGRTKITILRGTYTYTGFNACVYASGTQKLKGGTAWIWRCD